MTDRIRYRLDDEGKRRRVRMFQSVEGYDLTFTRSCTGCCDLGECNGNASKYPYDRKAKCHVGNGCNECGYTGKRRESHWIPFDYDEMSASMRA